MVNLKWVENKKVADWLVEIWENFKRIAKFWGTQKSWNLVNLGINIKKSI